MTNRISDAARRLCRGGAAAAAILLLAGALSLPSRAAPPGPVSGAPAAGMGRIWIYRDYEPYETLARPYVRLNGAVAGISEPGGSFYRDVPPGTYQVTVDSDGEDVNQFVTIIVAPAETAYIKVESLRGWDSGGGGNRGGGGWARDTFYTRLIPPELGQAEIAHEPFYGGG
jgi:hypothetical protein